MVSEKSKTNKKWTPTEKFRDNYERIFRELKGVEAKEEEGEYSEAKELKDSSKKS